MKYLKYLLLLIGIFLLTGCWNYRELNQISLVSSIGIDKIDNEFNVSVGVLNSKKVASNSNSGSGSDETPFVIYESKAKTIKEALNNMIFEMPNEIFIGHISLIAVSDEVAREGLKEFIDFLMADTESRKIFPFVIVKNGKAVDALKIILPLETVNSDHLKGSIEATAKINSMVGNRLFDEVIMCLYMEGREPTATTIEIIGDPNEGSSIDNLSSTKSKASIKISGSAAFKDDKLVGYLSEKESLGYTIIRNKANSVSLSFSCNNDENYGNVVIDNVKNTLKVDIIDNKPVAKINITGRAALPELDCPIDITDQKNIKMIEEIVNNELTKIIDNTLQKLQKELNTDTIGFGERVYKDHNKFWQKNQDNWYDIFPNMKYEIKSNITLSSVAATIRTAKKGGNYGDKK